MKRYVRPLAAALALTTALAGASYAHPAWVSDLGIDFWNMSDLQARLDADLQRAEELNVKGEQVLRRIALKDRLISDLLAGRSDLFTTAARFRALNEAMPAYLSVIRATYAGTTDDERICRNVIGFVECQVARSRPDLRPVVVRLKGDLDRRLASGGPLLPAKASWHGMGLDDDFVE